MPTEGSPQNETLDYLRLLCSDIKRLELTQAPISGALLTQLTYMMMTPEQGHDPVSILKVIHQLENDPDITQRAVQPFTQQESLQGLYKVHYYDAPFMTKNIRNALFKQNGDAKPRLKDAATKLTGEEKPSEADTRAIANEMISESLEERKSRPSGLTGEWIVMDKIDGRYRYLCLATHKLASDYESELVDMVEDAQASMSDTQAIYHWAFKRYQRDHWE